MAEEHGFPVADRLDSWKEIAAHLRRGVRSVQRWERECGMPVHRHGHARSSTVYAFRSELDAWWIGRRPKSRDVGPAAPSLPDSHDRSNPETASLRQRIAVMPFTDLSPEHDQAYFCSGLVEEIVTTLAAAPSLQVFGPSLPAEDDADPSHAFAQRRHTAELVLEGSVRRSGPEVRVSARLMRAGQREIVASFHCDGALDLTLALHEDVATRILAALRVKGQAWGGIVRHRPTDLSTYDLYLMARHYLGTRTIDGLRRSIALAGKAVDRDPAYGAAHAMLALAHSVLASYSPEPPGPAMEHSRRSAMDALALDDTLPDAHTAIGNVHFMYDWSLDAAEQDFRRAIELNPNDVLALQMYGLLEAVRGHESAALELLHRAEALDPSAMIVKTQVAWALYMFGRYDEALQQLAGTLRRDRRFWRAHVNVGICQLQLKKHQEAIDALETAVALNAYPALRMLLAAAYVIAGRRSDGRRLLTEIEANGQYVSGFYTALVHAALGDEQAAILALERAFAEREWHLLWLEHEPLLASIREHAAFRALVARTGVTSRSGHDAQASLAPDHPAS